MCRVLVHGALKLAHQISAGMTAKDTQVMSIRHTGAELAPRRIRPPLRQTDPTASDRIYSNLTRQMEA